ncbi:MAG TPA: hypothetical protein VFQ54_12370 [Thermomicrobiales bacterium]|nr:hypothetical protein [Thermomicrobiales bacterium]
MLIAIAFILFAAMVASWMILPLGPSATKPADAPKAAPALQGHGD